MSELDADQKMGPTSGKLFHVSRAGSAPGSDESLGPWTIEEIGHRLAKSEITITDFVYDDEKQDWIALVECEALKVHLRKAKPKAPPRAVAEPLPEKLAEKLPEKLSEKLSEKSPVTAPVVAPIAPSGAGEQAEWFVQKGTHRYGPYTYLSLVKALQNKSVYEFDFVWKAGMDGLVRIAEHEEFRREKIRALAGAPILKAESIFTERQHPRLRFESDVIVNDGRSAWTGRTFEGSAGGSGLVIENSQLQPGQTIRMHFAPVDGLVSFNAMAEIVNKGFEAKIAGRSSPVQYAVRFLDVDPKISGRLAEHFSRTKI